MKEHESLHKPKPPDRPPYGALFLCMTLYAALLAGIVFGAFTCCRFVRSLTDEERGISDQLGVEIHCADFVDRMETHGGFLGDGTTFYAIQMPHETAASLPKLSQWHPLPLTVYEQEHTHLPERYDPVTGDSQPLVPDILHGWYYLHDRTPSYLSGDDTFACRNFDMALYDADTNILYYFSVDT